jgi:hypothetical protein
LFCLFSGFYCFLSHIYLDCAAKFVLFGVGFSFTRTAGKGDERCEDIKSSLSETRAT